MATDQATAWQTIELLLADASSSSDTSVGEKLKQAQELVAKIRARQQLLDNGILNGFRLDGQVALVTGGGQGIGEALAHGLGEAGCKVAVADIEISRAEKVAADLEAKSIPAMAIKVDVANKAEVDSMVQKVLDNWGDLDIACNNAGIIYSSQENKSEDIAQSQWERTLAVNLNGVFYCCQAEGRYMLEKGHGKIINTASMSGSIVCRPQFQVAYNASKAGCVHLTKSLAAEWADRGVYVNSISPGYVDTKLVGTDALEVLHNQWIARTPMKRMANVKDLVGGVLYLASPLSNFTNGHDLVMDGGFTLW